MDFLIFMNPNQKITPIMGQLLKDKKEITKMLLLDDMNVMPEIKKNKTKMIKRSKQRQQRNKKQNAGKKIWIEKKIRLLDASRQTIRHHEQLCAKRKKKCKCNIVSK